MSSGYTGLVLDSRASRGLFKKVIIEHLETFETYDMITSSWHKVRTFKFKSKFKANLFFARVNAGQIERSRAMLKKEGLL